MAQVLRTPLVECVIGCAIAVHRTIGPGLFESVYGHCLARELECQGVQYIRQAAVPLMYRDIELECCFRVDFVVEGRLLVELKAVERTLPVHQAQVLTYLRLLNLRQGLLINFNVPRLVDGVVSVLNSRGPREKCEEVEK